MDPVGAAPACNPTPAELNSAHARMSPMNGRSECMPECMDVPLGRVWPQDADLVVLEFTINERAEAPMTSPERRAYEQVGGLVGVDVEGIGLGASRLAVRTCERGWVSGPRVLGRRAYVRGRCPARRQVNQRCSALGAEPPPAPPAPAGGAPAAGLPQPAGGAAAAPLCVVGGARGRGGPRAVLPPA